MIVDPEAEWDGPFPYQVLAPAGVSPDISQPALQDVPFALLTNGLLGADTQRALDQLTAVPDRLLVDLLLYPVDPATEIAAERAELDRELAAPGVPPELAEALAPRLPEPAELDAELGPIDLPEPPEVPEYAEFLDVVPTDLLDHLIRFDR